VGFFFLHFAFIRRLSAFLLAAQAQEKSLAKEKRREGMRCQGLRAPNNPAPPFEKGGRKLFLRHRRGEICYWEPPWRNL
jgi:hypothetical protein